MYCRKCYGKLDGNSAAVRLCPHCGRPFDPANPRTYLARPFPDARKAIGYVVVTSIISLVFAYIVACFQMAGASGH